MDTILDRINKNNLRLSRGYGRRESNIIKNDFRKAVHGSADKKSNLYFTKARFGMNNKVAKSMIPLSSSGKNTMMNAINRAIDDIDDLEASALQVGVDPSVYVESALEHLTAMSDLVDDEIDQYEWEGLWEIVELDLGNLVDELSGSHVYQDARATFKYILEDLQLNDTDSYNYDEEAGYLDDEEYVAHKNSTKRRLSRRGKTKVGKSVDAMVKEIEDAVASAGGGMEVQGNEMQIYYAYAYSNHLQDFINEVKNKTGIDLEKDSDTEWHERKTNGFYKDWMFYNIDVL